MDFKQIMSAVRSLCRDEQNPIMTFPIKKRISTDLFIDRKHELYIHKGRIKEIDRTSGRGATEIGSDAKILVNKNQ